MMNNPTLIGSTELIHDGQNYLFMGIPNSGKTRSMLIQADSCLKSLSRLANKPIYAVDPKGDIERALALNLDGHSDALFGSVVLVESVKDLPQDMSGMLLLIDEGRGYLSMIEHEGHITNQPRLVLSTIQVSKTIDSL